MRRHISTIELTVLKTSTADLRRLACRRITENVRYFRIASVPFALPIVGLSVAIRLSPDPAIRESSSSSVVVLVLDLLGFCAEKRADLLGNYFVPLVDGEMLEFSRTTASTRTRTTSQLRNLDLVAGESES